MMRLLVIFSALLILTGCPSTIKPQYVYNAQASDPVLVFNSDFELPSQFYVNIDQANNQGCKGFILAGYILHKDSIFLFDKPNPEFQIQVPADRMVSIKGIHSFNGGNSWSTCGPLFLSFMPEKGKRYLVDLKKVGDYCTLNISDRSDSPTAVKQLSRYKKCSR